MVKVATLPREAQQIDRLLHTFAMRYHECNPQVFPSVDEVYLLAFGITILNTDLHARSRRQRGSNREMTKQQFIRQMNCAGVGKHVSVNFLKVRAIITAPPPSLNRPP